MSRNVLVVGAARPLGSHLASRLVDDPAVDQLVGIDTVADSDVADPCIPGMKFISLDSDVHQAPVVAEVLRDAAIDTVVHLGLAPLPGVAGGRAGMKERNVLGTMQLLGACQRAPSVRSLVVRSSGVVYGNSARDPAMFTEDLEAREPPRSGFARDTLEVEGYVRGFARRRVDVGVTVLRLAPVLVGDSSTVESPLSRYFSLPLWPTPMGHDARLQFLAPEDAVEAIRLAALAGTTEGGKTVTYNVAAPGVLLLSQAARRAGRPTVPVPAPLAGWLGGWLQQAGSPDLSQEQMRYLSYGRVLDCAAIEGDLGFTPRVSTAEAFAEFLVSEGLERILPDDLGEQLLDLLRSLRLPG